MKKLTIPVLLVSATFCFTACKEKNETIVEETTVEETAPQPQESTDKECFLQVTESKPDAEGKIIRDSIIFKIEQRKGDSIYGIFHWKPEEKDKKIASYKGVLSGTTGTAIAHSQQEGMIYDEEVVFTLTDNAIAIKYGEMAEGKDGIWRYKDKNKAQDQILDKVTCQ